MAYDKSPFEPGAYVVYDGRGFAFRVRKNGPQGWFGFPAHSSKSSDFRRFNGRTLTECANKIEADNSYSI